VRVRQCEAILLASGYHKNVCQQSVGTLSTLSPSSIVVRVEDGPTEIACPLDSVARLDVSTGQRRRTGRVALIGLGIGAVVGAIVAVAQGDDFGFQSGRCIANCPSAGQRAVGGAFLLGIPGLVIGTVTVALIKTDRWEEVPLDRLRVSFAPKRDGRFALGLTYRF
jgi:hypothetical protein